MIPSEHVFGFVGFQEAVAGKVAEHPPADRMLEALQELAGEGGGLVEAEAGGGIGWVLIPVILSPVKEPIDDDEVEVEMRIQR
ncbi:MAG: hypothetical protein MUO50_19665 [Longimicrobiales bacterium]|nr:hypothetical protein [Longimicrobiales bacterium]